MNYEALSCQINIIITRYRVNIDEPDHMCATVINHVVSIKPDHMCATVINHVVSIKPDHMCATVITRSYNELRGT
jgi:hypothetical protein